MDEWDAKSDSSADTTLFIPNKSLNIFQRCWQAANLLCILICKTNMMLRRKFTYVVATYFGITAMFVLGVISLRLAFRYHTPDHPSEMLELKLDKDWILGKINAKSRTQGVILIGYAPRFPLIEALMEEAERILVRNGLPSGVKEFQVVPFESEYSMAGFLRRHQGVLRYAYAFDIPGRSYTSLSTTLDIISYIHDTVDCYKANYPPCPGEVYIGKVIMEAFINAHTGRETNVTLSYRLVERSHRRDDPIFTPGAERTMIDLFTLCMMGITWILVYIMAEERECGLQVALSRMGVCEGLNYVANILSLFPHVIAFFIMVGLVLTQPLYGNTPILASSDPGLLLVHIICDASSLMAYCVLGSVLLPRAHQCVIVACCLFAVGVYLSNYWDPPVLLRYPISIVPVVGTQKGFRTTLQMEKTVRGLKWDNTNLIIEKELRKNSPRMEMTLLFFSVPIQLLLTILIVYLRDFSLLRSLQGILRRWLRFEDYSAVQQNMNSYEAQSEEGRACVVLNHVENKFDDTRKMVYTEGINGQVSLRDVTWTIKEGEVSVATGLENSGRLAVLSVLYGTVRPVSGTATVFGLDCARHSTSILRNCGVCSRSRRAVSEHLTVRQNLRMFSQLRYHCQQREKDNVDSLVGDGELKKVLDTEVAELKDDDRVTLNVALAFTGDSKLVILEDPTKDMDIHTKMRVWNIIKNHSKGRTVIISTMCMAEAQMIGDRITVFMDGAIHCSGTVPYLNAFFDTGYILDIEKRRAADTQTLVMLCHHFCPDSKLLEDSPRRCLFLLPSTYQVEKLLDSLEENQAGLGITNFDVQGSTLENAFMNLISGNLQSASKTKKETRMSDGKSHFLKSLFGIARQGAQDQDKGAQASHSLATTSSISNILSSTTVRSGIDSFGLFSSWADPYGDDFTLGRRTGLRLCLMRLWIMLRTQFLISCRRMETECIQALMIILLVLYYAEESDELRPEGEHVVSHRQEPEICPSFVALSIEGGLVTLSLSEEHRRLWLTLKNVHGASDSELPVTCLLTKICLEGEMGECIQNHIASTGPPEYGIMLGSDLHNLSALLFVSRKTPGKSLLPAVVAVMETYLQFATKDTEGKFKIEYRSIFPRPTIARPVLCLKLGVVAIIIFICIPYIDIMKRVNGYTMLLQISGCSPIARLVSKFLIDMTSYLLLAAVYFLATQHTVPVYPHVGRTDWLLVMVVLSGAVMLLHIYFLQRFFDNAMFGTAAIMALIFLSAEVILRWDVFDVEDVTQMNPLFLLLPCFLLPEFLCHFGHYVHMDYQCPEGGLYCRLDNHYQDYCCLGEHNEYKPVHFVYVGLLHLAFWTLSLFLLEYRVPHLCLRRVRRIVRGGEPLEAFSQTELKAMRPDTTGAEGLSSVLTSSENPSEHSNAADQSLGESIFLKILGAEERKSDLTPLRGVAAGQASSAVDVNPERAGGVSLSQSEKQDNNLQQQEQQQEQQQQQQKQQQQQREKAATNASDNLDNRRQDFLATAEGYLVISNLKKEPYLRNITATVTAGEIFCFVSSDIATSSEVLRCISGWTSYDAGSILLGGKPFGFKEPLSGITVGYCPKDEWHRKDLNARESLALRCSLRGVIDVKKEVHRILTLFKLEAHAKITPRHMSDCTLARFRVAKALVGEPDLILLDQPMANLDMVGKMTVWQAINRVKKRGKMVVMTSNSIDACAGLVSRVGIIVLGKVVFVSTPRGIRSRFSNSYSLKARLGACDPELVNMLALSLSQRFPHSEIFVDSLNYLHVLLPITTDSLADLFRLMESVKKHLKVSDFVLRHTTLDNVIAALEKEHQKPVRSSRVGAALSRKAV